MSAQLISLFDVPPYQPTRTSIDAAISVAGKTKSMRQRVLEVLRERPMTDEQIAFRLQMSPNTARPRRVELVRLGQVVQVGVTKSASGRDAALWSVPAALEDRA